MPRDRSPCVYIMASAPRGSVYIGVTSNLFARVWQHRTGATSGWADAKKCRLLVRFEILDRMSEAIAREKQLKNWHRPWKLNLVEQNNRHWQDLATTILGFDPLPEE